MDQTYELKPLKKSFVNYRFVIGLIISLVFFLIFGAIFFLISKIVFGFLAVIFLLITLFRYYILNVKYKKEKYLFYADKIIHKSGGLFSDNETELVVRNITHVTSYLPFIEHKLFGSGTIKIESAGSGVAEIRLASVEKPKEMYNNIINLMKNNGFALTQTQKVQEERPSSLGVFFEVFKIFFGTIFFIIIFGLDIIMSIIDSGALEATETPAYFYIAYVAVGLFFGVFFIILTIKFLDLKKRVYDVYTDTITYSEGFLSKNYSFIPIENLADSEIKQSLIDKIFGLYDVKISCQGSSQEISFKNMVNGPELESNIDKLIIGRKTEPKVDKKQTSQKVSFETKKVEMDTSFTDTLRMDSKKTLIPTLIFIPLFPIWIIMFIALLIKKNYTTYLVKPNSVEEQYNFITSRNKEFTNDKIMTVILKESFIDKWFGTCSIHFWSIGSSEDIKFLNVKKTDDLYKNILAKVGIKEEKTVYQMDSNFSPIEMLKATIFVVIFSLFILSTSLVASIFTIPFLFTIPLGIIIIGYVAAIIYRGIFYKKSKLTFFESFVFFQKGIFIKNFYYALNQNIKDISTISYPFSTLGSVKFNIAGEHVLQTGQRGGRQTTISNSFKINYIDKIEEKDELIDILFYKPRTASEITEIEQNIKNYTQESILIAKPDIINYIFPFFFIPPLWIIIPIIIWNIKVKSYSIESYRIISKWGIFYKKQKSILVSKIDHINFNEGLLNKIFKNGTITVNTLGSSMAELTIRNIKNYKEFYEQLKKNY